MSFLLTCKDESHPWIAEQITYSVPETLEVRQWNGRNHLVYRYEWVNGIENRAEGEKLLVNYLYCASGAFYLRLQYEKGVIHLGSDTPPLGRFKLGVRGICSPA